MGARWFRRSWVVTVVLLAGVIQLRSTSAAALMQEATSHPTPEEVFEARCSVCHETAVVIGPFRAPADWDDVLDRMKSYGVPATDEDLTIIRGFLLKTLGRANVNATSARDLALVLDVPAAVADAVVTYRTEHGLFKTLDDLKKVPGLDPAVVDARKERVMF